MGGGGGGVMIIWQSAFKPAPLKNILVHILRTENWLVECTSNTLLSCPTALSINNTQIKYKYPEILYSDLNSWCFSIVKKKHSTGWLCLHDLLQLGKKIDDINNECTKIKHLDDKEFIKCFAYLFVFWLTQRACQNTVQLKKNTH